MCFVGKLIKTLTKVFQAANFTDKKSQNIKLAFPRGFNGYKQIDTNVRFHGKKIFLDLPADFRS